MGGNQEDHFGASHAEPKSEGGWGPPPTLHRWCLKADQPGNTDDAQEGQSQICSESSDTKEHRQTPDFDAEDDSGLELSLGLSLGGTKSSKPKAKDKEKEAYTDRDGFRIKDSFRDQHADKNTEKNREGGGSMETSAKGAFLDAGVSINGEQKGGRVQAFWQEFGRTAPEGREKGLSGPFPSRSAAPPHPGSLSEGPWRPAENSVAEDSKIFAQSIWQALQEKAAQPEHQRLPLSVQDEASLIKELQGLPPQAVATAAAWARIAAQGAIPLQLLEAFKDGMDPMARGVVLQTAQSMNSLSAGKHTEAAPAPAQQGVTPASADMPHGVDLRNDPDAGKGSAVDQQQRQIIIQQQDMMEQQRKREMQTQKRQEARKKRKLLLEGQKQLKKSKKEDDKPGPSGPPGVTTGKTRPGTPPNQLRRTNSSLPPSPPLQAKEGSISSVSSPPDSQEAGGAMSLAAFRRPGSSTWAHNWDAIPQASGPAPASLDEKGDKPMAVGVDQNNEEGEQLLEIRRALQRERDRATKDRGRESDGAAGVDSSGDDSCRGGVPELAYLQNRNEGLGPPGVNHMDFSRTQMDPAWIQKVFEMQMNNATAYQVAAALMESSREGVVKGQPNSNNGQQRRGGDAGTEKPSSRLEPERGGERTKPPSQSDSVGSENSDQKDEKHSNNGTRFEVREGETPSSRPMNSGGGAEGCNRTSNCSLTSGPVPPASSAIGGMTYPPNPAFPLMHVPYPFPISVPAAAAAGGVPFSVPFPFPYLMQFAPAPAPGGEGNQEQRPTPNMPNPFQISVPAGYSPFQLQTHEGPAAWAPAVLRPQPTPPHSPPRNGSSGLKRTQSGMTHDDDNRNSQGAKGNEHTHSRSTSPARDSSTSGMHPLLRAGSMGSGAFARLQPSSTSNAPHAVPPAPQFGPSRTKSDAGERLLRREGSNGSAFASLVDTPPGGAYTLASPMVTNGPVKGPASQGAGVVVSQVERSASRVSPSTPDEMGVGGSGQPGTPADSAQSDLTGVRSFSSLDEESKGYHGGVWRQGSLPNFEGLAGQEASSLRPGVAAGQTFGGTGSLPDLPWVTCTGVGPNGKTICGVLYRVDKGQVRIVCACHGCHMSPAEFVQHAGCGDLSNPEKAIVVGPFPLGTQTATAQA